MAATTPLEALRGFAPYSALPEDALVRLAEHSRLRVLAENERIAARDEPVCNLYLILEGSLLCLRQNSEGRERTAFHFNAGDSLGETLLLKRIHYPYDVTAVQNLTRVIETDGEVFIELFRTRPELQTSLVESMTDKVLTLGLRVVNLSLASANTRLARYVLDLPRNVLGAIEEVELPLPKKDLAALLAITPEHLSRILRRWSDARIVRMAGRGLQLTNKPILEAMADLEEEHDLRAATA